MTRWRTRITGCALALTLAVGACASTTKLSDAQIQTINDEETYGEAPDELQDIFTSTDQMEAKADVIARIQPRTIEVVSVDGYPMTQTTVEVKETLKGTLDTDTKITIVEAGGDGEAVAGGVPVMSKDHEYVLYLTPHEGNYYVVGATQGRFIVREGYAFQQTFAEVKLANYEPQALSAFEDAIRK